VGAVRGRHRAIGGLCGRERGHRAERARNVRVRGRPLRAPPWRRPPKQPRRLWELDSGDLAPGVFDGPASMERPMCFRDILQGSRCWERVPTPRRSKRSVFASCPSVSSGCGIPMDAGAEAKFKEIHEALRNSALRSGEATQYTSVRPVYWSQMGGGSAARRPGFDVDFGRLRATSDDFFIQRDLLGPPSVVKRAVPASSECARRFRPSRRFPEEGSLWLRWALRDAHPRANLDAEATIPNLSFGPRPSKRLFERCSGGELRNGLQVRGTCGGEKRQRLRLSKAKGNLPAPAPAAVVISTSTAAGRHPILVSSMATSCAPSCAGLMRSPSAARLRVATPDGEPPSKVPSGGALGRAFAPQGQGWALKDGPRRSPAQPQSGSCRNG